MGWCTFLHRKPVAYATIKKYLSALKSSLALWNDDLLGFESKRLEMCLRGIRKACPHRPQTNKRMPVTIWVLREFFRHLRTDVYYHRMIKTAMITGVYALLRAGEFAAKDALHIPLLRSDVRFLDSSVVIRIGKSKTDIFRYGVDITLWKDDSETCPYTHLKDLFDNSPLQFPGAPLFQNSDGSPLLYTQLVKATKELAQHCGFKPTMFAGHSFRIGGATTLALLGYEAHIIKTLGRWTSLSYQLYTRVSQEQMQKASEAMSHAEHRSNKYFGGLSDTAAARVSWDNLPIQAARAS